MVEGDEGDIVAEQKSQQRYLVEPPRNKGEQHLPKGSSRPSSKQGCGYSVDGEDERRTNDGIERVRSEFAKAHLSELQSQRSSDGDLREEHELFYPRDGCYAAQVRREAEGERSQQIREGQAKRSCAEVSEEREAYEQQQGRQGDLKERLRCRDDGCDGG